jgi:hypothetical protein
LNEPAADNKHARLLAELLTAKESTPEPADDAPEDHDDRRSVGRPIRISQPRMIRGTSVRRPVGHTATDPHGTFIIRQFERFSRYA